MDIYSIEKSGLIQSDLSAVCFYFKDSQIFHLGILFLEKFSENAKFLHLARHHSLRTEIIEHGFWIRLGITNRQIRLLAGMCAMISESSSINPIPFSIYYQSNRKYFNKSGDYLHSGSGEGLTCATFVMAIFETLGIPLLLTDNWLVGKEDKNWHMEIISQMRKGTPDKKHFESMLRHVDCARYRPADIVIASSKKKGRPLPQKVVRKAYGALYKRVRNLSA